LPPVFRTRDASTPDTASRDGGKFDASGPPPKGGAKDAAADANYDWTMNCPNEMPPLGGSKRVDGPTVVMLSAPSGLYYGTPSAIGTGVIVRRLAPNGAQDLPLGDRWLPLAHAGPSGLFYSSSAGFQWYSPSEGRTVATWKNDEHLIPFFVGDSVEGVEKLGSDGGGPFSIVTLQASTDGGDPQTIPYGESVADLATEPGLITADANTLYYTIANTIYALATPGGQPQELATVDGLLWSLDLSESTLFVTVWGESSPPIHGGIVAVDRATGQQQRLVTADEIHETRIFGDNVYYATPDGTGSCIDLRRVPAAGGVPETLATSALFSFAFGPSQMYAATFSGLYEVPP
jgi:hypothetical protein